MSNAGFSAAVDYFGVATSSGALMAKESSENTSSQIAEALDINGDVVAYDGYGKTSTPSTTYAITGTAGMWPALGSIVTSGGKSIMVTQIVFTTQAGQPPTAQISGQEVPSGTTAKRTYSVTGTLQPRCKAQDVAGAFTPSDKFTAFTTTYSVDFVNQTVAGEVVACCSVKGRVEVQATMTDYDGTGSVTCATGWDFSSEPSISCPDANYKEIQATAFQNLTGTESSSS